MTKVKLFTHCDLDGIGCAIVLRQFITDVDVVYCDYGNVNEKVAAFLDGGQIDQYGMVFITDISVNEEVAERLDDFANGIMEKKIWLLDHHVTASWMNKYYWAAVTPIKVLEDGSNIKTSGTSMLFDFLMHTNGGKVPFGYERFLEIDKFVEAVRRWDTWDWKNVYGGEALPKDLNNLLYILGRNRFVNRFTRDPIVEFTETERLILDLDAESYKRQLDKSKRNMIVRNVGEGFNAGIVTTSKYHSELGNDLAELNPELDMIIMIDAETRKVSYRTVKDSVDVSVFAKKFGGGGHVKAAGSMFSDEYIHNFVDLYFNLGAEPDTERATRLMPQ